MRWHDRDGLLCMLPPVTRSIMCNCCPAILTRYSHYCSTASMTTFSILIWNILAKTLLRCMQTCTFRHLDLDVNIQINNALEVCSKQRVLRPVMIGDWHSVWQYTCLDVFTSLAVNRESSGLSFVGYDNCVLRDVFISHCRTSQNLLAYAG